VGTRLAGHWPDPPAGISQGRARRAGGSAAGEGTGGKVIRTGKQPGNRGPAVTAGEVPRPAEKLAGAGAGGENLAGPDGTPGPGPDGPPGPGAGDTGDQVPGWASAIFRPNAISVDAGFFTWEITTGAVICDSVTLRLHGLPEGAATKTEMADFLARVPEPDLPEVTEAMRRMVRACGTYQIEYRVRDAAGKLRSMEARGRVLPGPGGQPDRMIGVVMDTTALRAQREAEQRRLREGADRARRIQAFTAALASAVTVDAAVEAAREGLRAYGADSLIVVAQLDGRPDIAASCGYGEPAITALSGLRSAQPAPMSEAIRTSVPVFLCSPAELAAAYPSLGDATALLTQQAWAALPVTDSAGRAGCCLFGFPQPHTFPPPERALLVAAAGLIAQSLERARMHEAEHRLATELQRGMLPRGMLSAPGMTIITRYQAATTGMAIGGDFYDVIRLPDGRVALVIGDVQGHNLFAASLMGRLRTAVHAYAREGHDPAEVMARTNRWLADLNDDPDRSRFATCCFMAVRPATGEVAMCRAGHPPPILLPPGRAPAVLEHGSDPPLGIEPAACYEETSLRIEPGSVLVLATDGLLETDDGGTDGNLRRLLAVLRRGPAANLDKLADRLLGSPRPGHRHGDDVALLLARLDPAAG
jgi:serine phosphatase RsbU (regulator of sigma subunit)